MSTPQRRRNLESQRERYESERATVENGMATASLGAMAEWSAKLEHIERRLREIDTELMGGDPQTLAYRRAVDQLGQWTGNLQTRIHTLEQAVTKLDGRLEEWIESEGEARQHRQHQLDATLTEMRTMMATNNADWRQKQVRIYRLVAVIAVSQVVMLLVLWWFGSQVWQITALWR